MEKHIKKPTISMIAAIDENNALGFNNDLLCYLPDDLKNFKKNTLHKPVIMGRRTFESIKKPLPNRINIVLTSNSVSHCEVISAKSLIEALDIVKNTHNEIMLIGGESVYREGILLAEKLYITQIKHKFPKADVFFPTIKEENWELSDKTYHPKDKDHAYDFEFLIYLRKQ